MLLDSYTFPEYELLYMKFGGEYRGAEIDEALLQIAEELDIETRYKVRLQIYDLRDVLSVDLSDSDRARVRIFERRLLNVFSHPIKDALSHLNSIKRTCIRPIDPEVAAQWDERIRRLKVGHEAIEEPLSEHSDLAGALEHLGLGQSYSDIVGAIRAGRTIQTD